MESEIIALSAGVFNMIRRKAVKPDFVFDFKNSPGKGPKGEFVRVIRPEDVAELIVINGFVWAVEEFFQNKRFVFGKVNFWQVVINKNFAVLGFKKGFGGETKFFKISGGVLVVLIEVGKMFLVLKSGLGVGKKPDKPRFLKEKIGNCFSLKPGVVIF